MKVLSFEEMNNVSGAYSWGNTWDIFSNIGEAIASAALGASLGFMGGAIIGGKHGGDGGGLLGIGSIGQGVGMIGAGIIGAIGCGVAATVVGFDSSWEYARKAMDGIFNGTWVL
ncbi:hypothetical protein [Cedecea colo]|uniref:Colicin V synthesis protein n=1 Tax=Cedecea colo TaxID=2552946 RepID=A0ABX0VLA3_9ENTR|nr:hypothetical protein [Cedecea colo]NIY47838.1 hypothetical protein [Cedecea colo]